MDIKELEKQRDLLDAKIKKYYEDKINEEMKKLKQYIGKCYKREMSDGRTLYIKITSISNKYSADVLEFYLPISNNDVVFEYYNYALFGSTNIWEYIGNWTEITPEEFDEKMDVVYNRLKQIVNIL